MNPDPRLADPYVRLLRDHLDDPELLASSPERAHARRHSLVVPFLEYFLRNDRDAYYRGLFSRKGLLDGDRVRASVRLEDLAGLRMHSDDLRAGAQAKRLVPAASAQTSPTYRSSGTSGNASGPVLVARTELQHDLMARAMGPHIAQMVGRSLAGLPILLQAAPEMLATMALPAVSKRAFEHLGAKLTFGSRLRDDPNEPVMWKRLEPDREAIDAFLGTPGPKVWFAVPPAIAAVIDAGRPFQLGEGSVVLTGGGMKQRLKFATLAELVDAAAPIVRAGERPAPIVDALGLTESASVFGPAPGDDPWLKRPHPLTWVGLFESPRKMTLVEDRASTGEHLLFYVNFTCVDYLEAIVPGDLVTGNSDGFIYKRRAGEAEGFAIREGCG